MRDDVAFQIINDELYLDGNARQNLATFCQTWDDENVHKLMDLSINKNWIDKEEYQMCIRDRVRSHSLLVEQNGISRGIWSIPSCSL